MSELQQPAHQEFQHQEIQQEVSQNQKVRIAELGEIVAVCEVKDKNGQDSYGRSFVTVALKRSRDPDIFCYMDVVPKDENMEEVSFPLGMNLILGACASLIGGSHRSVMDHRGEWSCRFTNGLTSSRFVFFRLGEEFVYEVFFVKKAPPLYRLIGKFVNMIAPVETWSFSVDANPPITVSKKIRDMKPIVEILTPRSSVTMNREEVLATLAWFNVIRTAKNEGDQVWKGMGAFIPSNAKIRKLVFGLGAEDGTVEESFRVYGAVYRDENLFRMLMGLLSLTVFVV